MYQRYKYMCCTVGNIISQASVNLQIKNIGYLMLRSIKVKMEEYTKQK